MSRIVDRRQFLAYTLGSGFFLTQFGARPQAAQPWRRAGEPRMLLGLAAYSFRDFFRDASHERARQPDPAKALDLFGFIDYCADHGCLGAELTSYYFPRDTDAAFLRKLRHHAFLRGVAISGTAVGNSFTSPDAAKRKQEIDQVKRWVDNAQIMGAPHIRVFAGSTGSLNLQEAKRLCIEALEECCEYAGEHGVFLGLENHGGITAQSADLLDMVQAVKSPWLGINLDTGNFHTPHPYEDLERCAPYAVNVQLKVEIRGANGRLEETNFDRLFKILRDANYQGYVTLEYEASPNPFEAIPNWLGKMRPYLIAGS